MLIKLELLHHAVEGSLANESNPEELVPVSVYFKTGESLSILKSVCTYDECGYTELFFQRFPNSFKLF